MNRSHSNHTYKADKMFPIEILKRLRKKSNGEKYKKHTSIPDGVLKKFHTKKCRQWSKELVRKWNY